MATTILRIPLDTAQHVEKAWRAARKFSGLLGLDDFEQTRLATAVSSVARDSFRSGAGAVVEFATEAAALIVRVTPYLGHDLDSETACRLVDHCEIEPGERPSLRMEKLLPPEYSRQPIAA